MFCQLAVCLVLSKASEISKPPYLPLYTVQYTAARYSTADIQTIHLCFLYTAQSQFLKIKYQHEVCYNTAYQQAALNYGKDKGKAIPIIGLDRPCVFQEVEAPIFQDNRHMKVVRLSVLRTGRLYPPGNTPGTHFCQRLCRPQGHSAAGRIMSMKNSSDTTGIEPAAFRLVAQYLNQLRYSVPPNRNEYRRYLLGG